MYGPPPEPKVPLIQLPPTAAYFVAKDFNPRLVTISEDNVVRGWKTYDKPDQTLFSKEEGLALALFLDRPYLLHQTDWHTQLDLLTMDPKGTTKVWEYSDDFSVPPSSIQLERQSKTRIVGASRIPGRNIVTIDEEYRLEYWNSAGLPFQTRPPVVLTSGSWKPLGAINQAFFQFTEDTAYLLIRSGDEVRVWDLKSEEPNQILEDGSNTIAGVRFIPYETGAIVTLGKNAKIWTKAINKPWQVAGQINMFQPDDLPTSVVYVPGKDGLGSSDGAGPLYFNNALIFGTNSGKISAFGWVVNAGWQPLTSFDSGKPSLASLLIVNGGELATIHSAAPQSLVQIWDFPFPKLKQYLPENPIRYKIDGANDDYTMQNAQFSANGQYVITQYLDRTTNKVKIVSWKRTETNLLQLHPPISDFDYVLGDGTKARATIQAIENMMISNDGTRVILYFWDNIVPQNTIAVFDLTPMGAKPSWVFESHEKIGISANGRRLAVTAYNSGVKMNITYIFDLETPGLLVGLIPNPPTWFSLAFSADGQFLVTLERKKNPNPSRGDLLYATSWDLRDPNLTKEKNPAWLVEDDFYPSFPEVPMIVSDDGQSLMIGSKQQSTGYKSIISLWNLTTSVPTLITQVSRSSAHLVALSPMSSGFALIGQSVFHPNGLELWNIGTSGGAQLLILQSLGYYSTMAVSFPSDHELQKLEWNDRFQIPTAVIWDLTPPKARWQLPLE